MGIAIGKSPVGWNHLECRFTWTRWNLWGFYSGASAGAPRNPDGIASRHGAEAGAFDGILGVVLAAGLVESLDRLKLPFGIEIVGFSERRGSAVWSSVYRKPRADRPSG